MARKAKKAKPKRTTRPSSALAKRVIMLEHDVGSMRLQLTKLLGRTERVALLEDKHANLHGVVNEVTKAVDRLIAGHSGDPAAHAALAPQATAEPADAPASESV